MQLADKIGELEMKKIVAFSVLCVTGFGYGVFSVLNYSRGAIVDSTISYQVNLLMQIVVAALYFACLLLCRYRFKTALKFFKVGCVFGASYSIVRGAESIINAGVVGIDMAVAAPIAGVTALVGVAIFIYFYILAVSAMKS